MDGWPRNPAASDASYLSLWIGAQSRPDGRMAYIVDLDREIPPQSGPASTPMKGHLTETLSHEINKAASFRY